MFRKNHHPSERASTLEHQVSLCYNETMKKRDTTSGNERIERALSKARKMGLYLGAPTGRHGKIDLKKLHKSASKIRNDVVECHEEITAV